MFAFTWKKVTATFARNYSQEPLLITTFNNGVRRLVLNDPKTRNALSMDMMNLLRTSLTDTSDPFLRCIVLSAKGPVFSSGHNLKHLAAASHEEREQIFRFCGEMTVAVSSSPVPIIAAVDGVAAAAGCQLVASCDIAIATKRSQFSTPGAHFGLFCSAPGVAVSRSAGRKGTAKMLLTGLPVSAEEAARMGLITEACDDDQLDELLATYTNAIVSQSRAVIALGKNFYNRQRGLALPDAYREAAGVMADNLDLPDGQEGVQSFIGKRKPVWKHE